MRRSDEEFKAELLLRVEEYKARQRKRRQNALRAASVSVMVCVLAVSSQWGKIADEEWYRPTAEGTVPTDETAASGETESLETSVGDLVTEPTTVPATENHAETLPEKAPVQEEATDMSAMTAGLSGVSIWEQKVQYNSVGSAGSADETKNYQDGELAEELLEFLTERIETAKEIAEESTTAEKPESGGASEESNMESVSSGKKYRITIRYADGRAVAYQVAEGKGELKIKGGRLILDQESWGQLMQIMGAAEPETQAPGTPVAAMDLMEGILAKAVSGKEVDEKFVGAIADFSVKLFQHYKLAEDEKLGENVLISPLSALLALAMTANGADGQTLKEMETVLAGGIPIEVLNQYLYTYTHSLPSEEKAKFEIANSIWFRDREGFTVQPEFLQTNADYYGAAARKEPFDDGTKDAINEWVNENTDGLIKEIISSPIPADTVMYLINAIVFDAKWAREYSLNDIYERDFTAADGSVKKASMMWSEESRYLDDGSAAGFVKPYAGGAYSFAALLPDEGVNIHDYIASLTGEKLLKTLSGVESASVSASLPKFSYEDETLMNEELKALGMPTAFSSAADFTDMARSENGYICIGNVLQKTFIAVDELGTKAGAVTSVEMTEESVPVYQYTVRLDRPFVYMIIDNATNLPIFIGAVMDIEE